MRVLDLRPLFLDAKGALNARMSADGVHVTEAGRAAWMEAIEPHLEKLLGAPR